MGTTGIIRRMDALGRIVIPKEFRKTLNIEVGDPIEIFIEENCVISRKYHPTFSVDEALDRLCAAIHQEPTLVKDENIRATVYKLECLINKKSKND